MVPNVSVSVGDVFRVPLNESRVSYGQVAATFGTSGGHFYFVGFRTAFGADDEPGLTTIVEDKLALLALSMDPLLQVGHWSIVGHSAVEEERIPWPTYKIAIGPGKYVVEDHLGTVTGEATDANVDGLRFRMIVAPIRFERALKALHGLEEWIPEFSHLLIP